MDKDKLMDQEPKLVESNNAKIHQSSDNEEINTPSINYMQPVCYYMPPYMPQFQSQYNNQFYMYYRNDGNDQNLPFNNTYFPNDLQFYPNGNSNLNTKHKKLKQPKNTFMNRNMENLNPVNPTNNLPFQHEINPPFQEENQIFNQYLPNYHLNYCYQFFNQYYSAQLASNFNNLNLNHEFIPPNHTIESRPAYYQLQNTIDFKFNGEIEGSKDSRFFVIKSYSAEDVIHGIINNTWCSTENGNKKLNQAFNECSKKKYGSVYLFFSVNGSGFFCGMAEMISEVDFNTNLDFWAQDKWKGKISLKWIFVKDIPNRLLKNIILTNNENKPITKSRDTQEVFFDQAIQVVNIFRTYESDSNIIYNFDLSNSLKNSSNGYFNSMTTNSGEKSKRADQKNS